VRKALVLENWGDIEIYQLYIAIHPKHTPNTPQGVELGSEESLPFSRTGAL